MDWRCVNAGCPARLRAELLNFGRRTVMNIEGLGKAMVAQLLGQSIEDEEAADEDETVDAATVIREPLIHSIADLYTLNKEDLLKLERVGEKSAQALLDEIKKSKTAPLSRVLLGLGIRHVGERTAGILASSFGDIESLMKAEVQELSKINEIGPTVAKAYMTFSASRTTNS